jgi:phage terminase large subunit-like protein
VGVRKKRGLTRGERNAAWIESVCRIPEGKFVGKPVVLRDWQRDIVVGIYDTPTRQAIISFGRKNAKTTLAAMLCLLHLCGPEAVPNSQLVSAAQSQDQAALLFDLAAKIIRLSPELAGFVAVRDSVKQLHCAELGTLYKALSAEKKTSLGKSPVFAVHDELGQVLGPRSDLYESVETAMGAHDAPLSVVISTQAPTDADLLSILIDDAASGADPEKKLFLFTADPLLDPFSEEALRQANPAFGDFLNAKETRKTAEDARRMPSREASFRNLILNQRISQETPIFPARVWEACKGEVDEEVFRRKPVYIGLDLSARNDLTALAMVAKDDDGVWHTKVEFFAPLTGIADRAQRDRAPYDVWADRGLLTATPGASVDYDYVAEKLGALCAAYQVALIAFDPWRIDVLIAALGRLGLELPLQEFGQGYKSMSPALDTLEAELLQQRVRHGGHPILKWNVANAIAVRDPAGNRKPDKSKSTGRIDGIVALLMAIGVATAAEPPGVSFWEAAA